MLFHILYDKKLCRQGRINIFNRQKEEALKCSIDLMEKEILYFRGKRRFQARRKYLHLLHLCKKACSLEDPVYLNRQ